MAESENMNVDEVNRTQSRANARISNSEASRDGRIMRQVFENDAYSSLCSNLVDPASWTKVPAGENQSSALEPWSGGDILQIEETVGHQVSQIRAFRPTPIRLAFRHSALSE